jgi:hypothetical protein
MNGGGRKKEKVKKQKRIIIWYFKFIVSRDSVVGIATGWTTKGSEFESQWGQVFSLLHVVQTGSEVHPTYPVGIGGSFPVGKAAGA